MEALQSSQKEKEKQLPLGLSVAYWQYLNEYDQVVTAQRLEKPMLIIQGGRDYQVNLNEFKKWQTALADKPTVTFKNFEKLNHIMREGETKSYPKEYQIASPLPAYFSEYIASWIKKN